MSVRATTVREPVARRAWDVRLLPASWPAVLLGLLLAYLTLLPIGVLVWGSLRDAAPGLAGNITLANYVKVLTTENLFGATLNSLVFGLGSALLATAIGVFLAWVVVRTNAPGRWLLWSLAVFPLLEPGVLKAIAWVLLLNPQAGVINGLVKNWLGIQSLFNIYSLPGMIWIQATAVLTLPFLVTGAAFRAMDPSLEQAAAVSGCGTLNTLRRITLPLILPSCLATLLLLFVYGIETFDVPAVAGIPGKIPVFAAQIWLESSINGNFNVAAAYSMPYLLVAVLGLWLYYRAAGMAGKYSTVTGKNFRPTRMDLGAGRWPMFALSLLLVGAAVVPPVLVLLYTSFLPFFILPSAKALAAFRLDNYAWILGSDLPGVLVNNVVVGVAAALCAVLLATLVSWVTIRTAIRGRRLLDVMAFAPVAFPGAVMGLALVWTYLTIPNPIYGTLVILVVGFVAKFLPIAMRSTHASLLQLHRDLDEAAAVSGASFSHVIRRIILPLIMPANVVAFIYILSLTFKDLSLPMFLVGFDNQLLATQIYSLYQNGQYGRVSAIGVLLLLLLLGISGLSALIGARFGVREVQS
ncbi:MAG TPA: iron ABC transporter permease [Chloroflexota bacterium]|jgi:iron(III) transport system permease protein